MQKAFYVCTLLLLCSTGLQAQVRFMNGYLRDSITLTPISEGTITNATKGKSTKTDSKGFFRLRVAPNDRIYAIARSYHFDTLTYSPLFADTVTLYLSPTGSVLPTVTVTSPYSRYQYDSIERRRAFEEVRGPAMHTVASTPATGFGLSINLDKFFKTKYRQQKRLERTYNQAEEDAYMQYRFSPDLVSSVTGLKGAELNEFIRRYTPSYTWLRQHPTDEAVLYYLNEKMKEYRTTKKM